MWAVTVRKIWVQTATRDAPLKLQNEAGYAPRDELIQSEVNGGLAMRVMRMPRRRRRQVRSALRPTKASLVHVAHQRVQILLQLDPECIASREIQPSPLRPLLFVVFPEERERVCCCVLEGVGDMSVERWRQFVCVCVSECGVNDQSWSSLKLENIFQKNSE